MVMTQQPVTMPQQPVLPVVGGGGWSCLGSHCHASRSHFFQANTIFYLSMYPFAFMICCSSTHCGISLPIEKQQQA
ncbi:unnamed protein product [Closterium sp. NIES-53]